MIFVVLSFKQATHYAKNIVWISSNCGARFIAFVGPTVYNYSNMHGRANTVQAYSLQCCFEQIG